MHSPSKKISQKERCPLTPGISWPLNKLSYLSVYSTGLNMVQASKFHNTVSSFCEVEMYPSHPTNMPKYSSDSHTHNVLLLLGLCSSADTLYVFLLPDRGLNNWTNRGLINSISKGVSDTLLRLKESPIAS
eukprot:1160793-Pelagomonas_calceolata.AAC.2